MPCSDVFSAPDFSCAVMSLQCLNVRGMFISEGGRVGIRSFPICDGLNANPNSFFVPALRFNDDDSNPTLCSGEERLCSCEYSQMECTCDNQQM